MGDAHPGPVSRWDFRVGDTAKAKDWSLSKGLDIVRPSES